MENLTVSDRNSCAVQLCTCDPTSWIDRQLLDLLRFRSSSLGSCTAAMTVDPNTDPEYLKVKNHIFS